MSEVPYKYLKDEHGTIFYPVIGNSSFNDAVPISKGGTGATTAMAARKNLGVAGGTMYFKNQVVNAATNAEILRITDPAITSDTVVVETTWYGYVTITGWTSYDGYITFNGTCAVATTADITLSIVDVPTQSAPLSIERGGTGANTTSGAIASLGILDYIYPVGSIYMSVNSTSPGSLFGGTWEPIQDTFLLAAGSIYMAGTSGGEATHTLTVDEMPNHNHTVPRGTNTGTTNWGLVRFDTLNASADSTRITYTGGG